MKRQLQDILDLTDPDGFDTACYSGATQEPMQAEITQQIIGSCTLEVTDWSLERAIDTLKRAFPRMRVAEFKDNPSGWPHLPPTFGCRWQLARIFVSKFAVTNPGPGEHLRTRSIHAYGYKFSENNQRLREIGSHLLSSVASLSVMKATDDFSAPVMAAATSKLRQRDVLAALAYVYGLDELLLTGTTSDDQPRKPNQTMLADCFLALVAAVYQDNDWHTMSKWLEDLIQPILSLVLECQDVKHTYDKNQEYALLAKKAESSKAPPSSLPPPSSPPDLPITPEALFNTPNTPKPQTHTQAQKGRLTAFNTWMELYAPGEKARFAYRLNYIWDVEIYVGERLLATASAPTKPEAESYGMKLALDKLEEDFDSVIVEEGGNIQEGEGEFTDEEMEEESTDEEMEYMKAEKKKRKKEKKEKKKQKAKKMESEKRKLKKEEKKRKKQKASDEASEETKPKKKRKARDNEDGEGFNEGPPKKRKSEVKYWGRDISV